jgi:hypothetical protein
MNKVLGVRTRSAQLVLARINSELSLDLGVQWAVNSDGDVLSDLPMDLVDGLWERGPKLDGLDLYYDSFPTLEECVDRWYRQVAFAISYCHRTGLWRCYEQC